jgi:hypothetical protein
VGTKYGSCGNNIICCGNKIITWDRHNNVAGLNKFCECSMPISMSALHHRQETNTKQKETRKQKASSIRICVCERERERERVLSVVSYFIHKNKLIINEMMMRSALF